MREILHYPQIDRQKLDMVKKLIEDIADNPNGDGRHELIDERKKERGK